MGREFHLTFTARVFEPFFMTKDVGWGTGMGLAVCHRIISAHKGKIEISDVEPHGTCLTISLPVGSIGGRRNRKPQQMSDQRKSTRVLVIDDEADVADLNVEGGCESDAAHHAEQAFEMLRNQRYDVVLSDLNMPEGDGRWIFEAISKDFPELISLTGFVTGDTMGRASQTFLKECRRPYIEEPVSPKELRAFVAQLGMEGTSE